MSAPETAGGPSSSLSFEGSQLVAVFFRLFRLMEAAIGFHPSGQGLENLRFLGRRLLPPQGKARQQERCRLT